MKSLPFFVGSTLLSLFGACGDSLAPRMVVTTSGTDGMLGATWDEADGYTCPTALTEDDAPLYVRHILHPKVTLAVPIKVVVETACGVTDATAHHVDSVASFVLLPPTGGTCGATVTATIANDTQRCYIPPAAGANCADLRAVCESDTSE